MNVSSEVPWNQDAGVLGVTAVCRVQHAAGDRASAFCGVDGGRDEQGERGGQPGEGGYFFHGFLV